MPTVVLCVLRSRGRIFANGCSSSSAAGQAAPLAFNMICELGLGWRKSANMVDTEKKANLGHAKHEKPNQQQQQFKLGFTERDLPCDAITSIDQRELDSINFNFGLVLKKRGFS